jgi:cytochrome c-type biogenesis protein CcmH
VNKWAAFLGLWPNRAAHRRLALMMALVAMAAPATASGAAQTTLSEIEAEVMCPVCGTLLQLSESPQAQREKVFISRLIAAGKSEGEIKDALVAQYGDEVLALPQGSGFSLSAYLVPIVAFLVAAVALALAVVRWRRAGGPPSDRPPRAAGPSEDDSKRLDEDLARYDL